MFCFSVLFARANSAVKHPITYKSTRRQLCILQFAYKFAQQHILVHKYNKSYCLFKKNIKNLFMPQKHLTKQANTKANRRDYMNVRV